MCLRCCLSRNRRHCLLNYDLMMHYYYCCLVSSLQGCLGCLEDCHEMEYNFEGSQVECIRLYGSSSSSSSFSSS